MAKWVGWMGWVTRQNGFGSKPLKFGLPANTFCPFLLKYINNYVLSMVRKTCIIKYNLTETGNGSQWVWVKKKYIKWDLA